MSNNWLQDLIKQQKELQERLSPSFGLLETTKKVKSIVPSIYIQSIATSPIYQYATEMQAIINRFIVTDLSIYNNITEVANDFLEEKQKAEDNYYHRFVVEENEIEIDSIKREKTELEQKVKELEITLKTMFALMPQNKDKAKSNTVLNLKPNLTANQIVKLQAELKDIFEGSIEQWRSLFSEDIKLDTPIKVNGYKSDVRVLFHFLKEKDLIETQKYPSILEKSKAFIYDGEILTAKQINAPKENFNYPNIGNYVKIHSIIEYI